MNFALILFILTVVTGVFWVAERYHFAPKRYKKSLEACREFEEANAEAISRGDADVIAEREKRIGGMLKQPWYMEYTAGLFPVILVVFLLRSFLFEPFRIPSGSMLPTLHVGDFILVNKYEYGVRLPVLNTKIIDVGAPHRGDVVVFRYPLDTSVDYIKRVVAVPGDVVEYRDKVLYLNGERQMQGEFTDFVDENTGITLQQTTENLSHVEHLMAVDPRRPAMLNGVVNPEPACSYNPRGFICKVPAGKYFVMGDNRDNSEDSRYWGFVPDENLVGRAVLIWANFSDMSRIGTFD